MGTTSSPPWCCWLGHGSNGATIRTRPASPAALRRPAATINARLLADLLNSPEVRACRAAAASTTTPASLPPRTTPPPTRCACSMPMRPAQSRRQGLLERTFRAWLQRAHGTGAGGTRGGAWPASNLRRHWTAPCADAPSTGLEVRPDKGLANNAGFIAAPRRRTRAIDLAGRCFLHDYDYRHDAGGTAGADPGAPHGGGALDQSAVLRLHRRQSPLGQRRQDAVPNVVGGASSLRGQRRRPAHRPAPAVPARRLRAGAIRRSVRRCGGGLPERLARAIDSTVAHLVDGAWLHFFWVSIWSGRCCVSSAVRAWVDAQSGAA